MAELPRELRIVVRPYATGLPLGFFAFGIGMLLFAFMIGILSFAAFLGKPLIGTLLLVSAVRAALNGAWNFGASDSLEEAAGWIAVGLFFAAAYGAIAFLLEDVKKETVLPVFGRGSSKDSLESDLVAQLARIDSEAGVRQTL